MEKSGKKKRRQPKNVLINLNSTHYDSVRDCALEVGYKITDSHVKSTINWHDAEGKSDVLSAMQPWQLYNHFPGIWSISRKVELAKNIERMRRLIPELYSFHPTTFVLPTQFNDLKTYMSKFKKKRTIIVKPDRGSQGKGIILIQDSSSIENYFDSAVAQEYIPPLLIDGYKFDLRIYVLITSIEPLRLYIHEEGMARFCTEKYVKPKHNNLNQSYSHLTNYSLNKMNDNFIANEDAEEADVGSKRSMSSVFAEIAKMGHDTEALQTKIDNIIRLTIASVQGFVASTYRSAVNVNDGKSRCFEILGFDIMIDKYLNPWLIEVNCMPSLTCDSPFDTELKYSVVKGTMQILDLNPGFKSAVKKRLKAVTEQRMTGKSDPNLLSKSLFEPMRETEIAATTNWRQLYPMDLQDRSYQIIQKAMTTARQNPVGAAIETYASRIRKEKVLTEMKSRTDLTIEVPASPPRMQIRKERSTPDLKAKLEPIKNRSRESPVTKTPVAKAPIQSDKPKRVEPKTDTRVIKIGGSPSKRLPMAGSPRTFQRKQVFTRAMPRIQVSPYNSEQVIITFGNAPPEIIDDREEMDRRIRISKNAEKASLLNLMTYVKTMIGDKSGPSYPESPVRQNKSENRRFVLVQQFNPKTVRPLIDGFT